MPTEWALQDARNRLSEVVDRARDEGPQMITRRGEPTAVVLSMDDYKAMTRRRGSLLEFFQASPLRGVDLELARDKDRGRDVKL